MEGILLTTEPMIGDKQTLQSATTNKCEFKNIDVQGAASCAPCVPCYPSTNRLPLQKLEAVPQDAPSSPIIPADWPY